MSERAQRVILWLLAIGLTLGTAIALRFAGGYRQIAGLGMAPSLLPPNIGLRLHQVQAVGRKNNTVAWKLSARQVDSTRDRSQVTFQGNVEMTLYSAGQPRATVTADTATYLAFNQMLNASGKIVGTLQDTTTPTATYARIETDFVQWEVGSHRVHAPNQVRLTLKEGEVRGNQLLVDLKTREYTLENFAAEFAVSENSDPAAPLENLLPQP